MSMLAEPRRKKAWVLNPRKSQWAEDESKFGQKMLEQMGWSKGKGLGRELTGITEHIRPSVQNDSRGLGYEGRTDDWVAHLDDFNDLLANLQQEKKDSDKENATKTNVKSLEERSKKSRARVHYHKFTRGKDLSRYSSQDLASILGGRSEVGVASQPVTPVSSRPPSPPPHADSEPTSETETEPPPAPTTEIDTSSGYTTINTGLSVKDYFAAKMRKMKMLKIKCEQEQQNTAGDKPREESKEDATLEPSEAAENVEQEEKKSKKKKKKKRPTSPTDEPLPSVPEEENVASEEPKKKKKRPASPVADVHQSVLGDENVTFEEPKKKKRKKRKNAESSPEEDSNAADDSPAADVSPAEDSIPAADASELVPSGETGEAPSKKKKKRKKSKSKRGDDSD